MTLPDLNKKMSLFSLGRVILCQKPLWHRKKGWPEKSLLITFGLSYRLDSPRVAVAVEPYPNRWTHHVLLTREEELDGELMGWLEEAWRFAQEK